MYVTDWIVSDDTVVRPDVMVICGRIEGDYPTRTPRIIFEIISPSTAIQDERLKFELYQSEGVGWYVLVYPERECTRIFKFEDGHMIQEKHNERDKYPFGLEENGQFEFDFARIWP